MLPRLWLALALHAQHKDDDARKELAGAASQMDKWGGAMPHAEPAAPGTIALHLHDWLEAHVLRREAENPMGPQRR